METEGSIDLADDLFDEDVIFVHLNGHIAFCGAASLKVTCWITTS